MYPDDFIAISTIYYRRFRFLNVGIVYKMASEQKKVIEMYQLHVVSLFECIFYFSIRQCLYKVVIICV